MRAFAIRRGAAHGELVGRILCHDVRGQRNEILLRKGHALRPDDLPKLFEGTRDEIHLLELEGDDIGQREAGRRLAEAFRSPGLCPLPSGHRHVLRAGEAGLLKVNAKALQRVNEIPGVAVFTLLNDSVVQAEEVAAEAQITPLAIARSALETAERMARETPVIRLLPFVPRDAILWTRRVEQASGLPRVEEKLRRFRCQLREVIELNAPSIRESIESRLDSGASLFLISGSNALDPLDPVLLTLEELNAKMQRIGMPVHPGTLLWIATLGNITIIGLPSCGLGTQKTGFDLILPKLLAEGAIREEEIAGMGHGGVLR
jgi:hypothetical protein